MLALSPGCVATLGGGRDAGSSVGDAGMDAGSSDAGSRDAGSRDAGASDAGASDAAAEDASVAIPDAGACPPGKIAFATFCMDRYEAPNEAGVPPLAMQSALDAEAWCAARGDRLCTEAEWVEACGARGTPYPYGDTYEAGLCNDDETWISPDWDALGTWPSATAMAEAARLYQGEPSGDNAGCVSADGVFDMTGNVAEWVRRSFSNSTNYDHVMKGCYWSGCFGGSPPSCGFVNPAHPSGFRSYEAGFRCCADR